MAYGLWNGHVTDEVTWPPKVLWGSTVGYASDSLAPCLLLSNTMDSQSLLLNEVTKTWLFISRCPTSKGVYYRCNVAFSVVQLSNFDKKMGTVQVCSVSSLFILILNCIIKVKLCHILVDVCDVCCIQWCLGWRKYVVRYLNDINGCWLCTQWRQF